MALASKNRFLVQALTTKRLSVVREPLTPLFPRTLTRTTDKRLLN
jgi:hypothetical protein